MAAPKAGEVRLKVVANALCHTDIYTLRAATRRYFGSLGHEAWCYCGQASARV